MKFGYTDEFFQVYLKHIDFVLDNHPLKYAIYNMVENIKSVCTFKEIKIILKKHPELMEHFIC